MKNKFILSPVEGSISNCSTPLKYAPNKYGHSCFSASDAEELANHSEQKGVTTSATQLFTTTAW